MLKKEVRSDSNHCVCNGYHQRKMCNHLCIKMASDARKLLQGILHLKEPFTESPRSSRRGSTALKKTSWCPRVSRKRQDHLLLRSQLWKRIPTSRACSVLTAGGCESICTQSEAKTFGQWHGVRKGSKEAPSLQENIKDILKFCRSTRIRPQKTGAKLFTLIKPSPLPAVGTWKINCLEKKRWILPRVLSHDNSEDLRPSMCLLWRCNLAMVHSLSQGKNDN